MNATLLYRIAAAVLILFAAGHTFGFLKFKPPTPEGVAVRDAMDNVHFTLGSRSYSYGGFYRGFGHFNTAYLLFAAFLAWHLAGLARANPQAIGPLGWVFFASACGQHCSQLEVFCSASGHSFRCALHPDRLGGVAD